MAMTMGASSSPSPARRGSVINAARGGGGLVLRRRRGYANVGLC
ncbi:uncharacterized protein G2W53_042371 [Senna tora]|uniref:Uncharacterized protein n=1 Tax=Senna tora TaxID=362788 RepID=A0A834SFA8_9FABA|nr:uncharacterized protein G2W53_042371 [Senna tora]